ncbi:MAG: AAA family ATPase [Candidatus Hodarchaeales archaeon]
MRFIGITGRMGAGKTTAARFIITENENYELLRIAGKLKSIVKELDLPYTRDTLQRVATFFRELDHDIWVKFALKEIDCLLERDPKCCVVIDDVRFENEASFLRKRGFKIIKIETAEDLRRKRIANRDGINIASITWKRWQEDPTEVEIDNIESDYTITNNGILDDFLEKSKDLIKNSD